MTTEKKNARIAVASRSFSKNPVLRSELQTKYEHVTFNETGRVLEGTELSRFLNGHSKAITGLEVINDAVLSQLKGFKGISKYGVGLDMIDLDALARHDVHLGWTGGVNRRSVAELTLMFALLLIRGAHQAHLDLVSGDWKQAKGHELTGKTVGIVGCGHVGKELIRLLEPFHCNILVNDIRRYPEFYQEHPVTEVNLPILLKSSDIVSLHIPLNSKTNGMLNSERLAWMKKGAVLLNTSRGNIVEEPALKALLKSGQLGSAGFDVYAVEPPTDTELLSLPNFYGTPHIGGGSAEAILAMGQSAIENLERLRPASDYANHRS